jgi:hypothetical protein
MIGKSAGYSCRPNSDRLMLRRGVFGVSRWPGRTALGLLGTMAKADRLPTKGR